jgi:outer membrane lipoprotein SlyB
MQQNWKQQDEQKKLVQSQRDYYQQEQLAKELAAQQKQVNPWTGAMIGAGTGAMTGAAAGGWGGAIIGAVAGGLSGYGGGQVSVPTNYAYLRQKREKKTIPYTRTAGVDGNLYSGGYYKS